MHLQALGVRGKAVKKPAMMGALLTDCRLVHSEWLLSHLSQAASKKINAWVAVWTFYPGKESQSSSATSSGLPLTKGAPHAYLGVGHQCNWSSGSTGKPRIRTAQSEVRHPSHACKQLTSAWAERQWVQDRRQMKHTIWYVNLSVRFWVCLWKEYRIEFVLWWVVISFALLILKLQ